MSDARRARRAAQTTACRRVTATVDVHAALRRRLGAATLSAAFARGAARGRRANRPLGSRRRAAAVRRSSRLASHERSAAGGAASRSALRCALHFARRYPRAEAPRPLFPRKLFARFAKQVVDRRRHSTIAQVSALATTIVAAYRHRVYAPGDDAHSTDARGAFAAGETRAPHEVLATIRPGALEDDEYLGPVEAPVASLSYAHNFTSMSLASEAASIGAHGATRRLAVCAPNLERSAASRRNGARISRHLIAARLGSRI